MGAPRFGEGNADGINVPASTTHFRKSPLPDFARDNGTVARYIWGRIPALHLDGPSQRSGLNAGPMFGVLFVVMTSKPLPGQVPSRNGVLRRRSFGMAAKGASPTGWPTIAGIRAAPVSRSTRQRILVRKRLRHSHYSPNCWNFSALSRRERHVARVFPCIKLRSPPRAELWKSVVRKL